MGSIPELWQGQVWGTLALVVATMAMVALPQNVWGMVNKHCGHLKGCSMSQSSRAGRGPHFTSLWGVFQRCWSFVMNKF